MASKTLVDIALKLSKQLGANTNKFLGSRSNISFLGKGPKDDLLFQADINTEALGAFPLNKLLPQIESSMGYLTGGKLNDLQANKLISNLEKIKEFNFPTQTANIIDLGTGTRDLTQEGIMTLRRGGDPTKYKPGDPITSENFGATGFAPSKVDLPKGVDPNSEIAASLRLEEKGKKLADSMSDAEIELRSNFPRASDETISAMLAKGKGSNEIEALETMTTNRAGTEFITGYVDDVYKNAGVTASVDVPKKRAAAREFLYNILKKETDLLPPGKGGTLESVISEADYKHVMEGGGGALGDPLIIVKKYFGDTIAKRIPLDTRAEVIDTFVENVRFTKDRAGRLTDDPRFNPDDIPDFAAGGRVGFRWGSGLSKALLRKIDKKVIKDAVDDIFPTGDYKMDAEMAAEALVENNPKLFGGKLLDDLNDRARLDVYGLVLGEVTTRFSSQVRKNRGIKSLLTDVNEQFGEGTLKRASDVTPSTKYDELKAIKDFEARNRTFSPNREKIKAYYQGKIDDELLDKILVDNDPQRIAEVLATIDEALLMQQRGMGSETIMQSLKDSWGRKKNAHGGLAKILEV